MTIRYLKHKEHILNHNFWNVGTLRDLSYAMQEYLIYIQLLHFSNLLWTPIVSGKKGDSKSTWWQQISKSFTYFVFHYTSCPPFCEFLAATWTQWSIAFGSMGKFFFLIFWNFLVLSSTQHQLPPLWCIFLPIWVILYMMQGLGWI